MQRVYYWCIDPQKEFCYDFTEVVAVVNEFLNAGGRVVSHTYSSGGDNGVDRYAIVAEVHDLKQDLFNILEDIHPN